MKMLDCLILIVLISFVSCSHPSSPDALVLGSSLNGTTVTFLPNQGFMLRLDLQADAGYQWDYAIADTNVVRIDSTCYAPKSGNRNQIGGVTVETFFFCTINPGRSVVTLNEYRPWEARIAPMSSMTFTVVVTR